MFSALHCNANKQNTRSEIIGDSESSAVGYKVFYKYIEKSLVPQGGSCRGGGGGGGGGTLVSDQ